MNRILIVVALALGLVAGHAISTTGAPKVSGSGGIFGSCSTANALAKFSSAFQTACSAWTDTGTTATYAGSTITISGGNALYASLTGQLDVRTTDSNDLWLGTNSARRWRVDSSGNWIPNGGTFTIGSGSNSPSATTSATYLTTTRCANTGSPATCSAAAAGSVVIAAAAASVVVNTTAVTANSQIFAMIDRSLGTLLSVTCDTTSDLTTGSPAITARVAATSFTIAVPVAPAANPMCLSYFIVN